MNQPKISVIVPVYKVEPYLRKCLDSIVNQTYRNLEIILVDDGSPDNCPAICDEYAAKDARIIVIHQANAGVSAARNAALDIATGDYIGFVDSDDWLELDMYEYLLHLAQTFDAHVSQCGYMEEGEHRLQLYTPIIDQMAQGGETGFSSDDWHKLSYANWNKLYRTEIVGELRFDENYVFGEDLLFNVQVLQRTQKVCFGSQAKYHYLQRQGSACYQLPTLDYLKTRQKALEKIVTLTASDPVAQKYFLGSLTQGKLDICSKIVRFYSERLHTEKAELRRFMRTHLSVILKIKTIPLKDRVKSVLIAHAWWLYRPLLLASKRMKGRKKTWND